MTKPKTPKIIYLIDMGDEISWCDDPAPGIGMNQKNAVKYIRVDSVPEHLLTALLGDISEIQITADEGGHE